MEFLLMGKEVGIVCFCLAWCFWILDFFFLAESRLITLGTVDLFFR
jgi:hypothetical protein